MSAVLILTRAQYEHCPQVVLDAASVIQVDGILIRCRQT